jgi:glycosyltransferase involved in cell wall biosynthesis
VKVSVFLLSFNRPDLLERALKSILIQDVEDMEVIISDDCSEERYWHRIRSLESLDHRVKIYRNEKNLGCFGNLNHSLDLVQGDWLLMFNDDDVMLPGMLKKEVEFVQQNPNVGFVYTDGYAVLPNGKKVLRSCSTHPVLKAGTEALDHVVFHFNIFATSVLVKRECYERLGRWTDTVSADWEMWARIARNYDIGHINEPLIEVYIHEVSSRSPASRYENDWAMLDKMVCSYYPEERQADLLPQMLRGVPEGFWSLGVQLWQQGEWRRGLEFMLAGKKYLPRLVWWHRFLDYAVRAVPRRIKYKMTGKDQYDTYV